MKNHQGILFLFLVFVFGCHSANAQQRNYTAKTIFAKDKPAIVQIWALGKLRGTGFVVSTNRVITANHVVNDPDIKDYLTDIQVRFNSGKVIKASPILNAPSEDSRTHDYAVLGIAEDIGRRGIVTKNQGHGLRRGWRERGRRRISNRCPGRRTFDRGRHGRGGDGSRARYVRAID